MPLFGNGGLDRSGNRRDPLGSIGGGLGRLLWITPTPPREDTAQIWIGDVPARAPAIVTVTGTVTTFAWNAVTPLPIGPLVAPAGPMPPASTVVTHQLDGRRRAELNRNRIRRERSRLCRYREGETDSRCKDQRAHLCLSKENLRGIVG